MSLLVIYPVDLSLNVSVTLFFKQTLEQNRLKVPTRHDEFSMESDGSQSG